MNRIVSITFRPVLMLAASSLIIGLCSGCGSKKPAKPGKEEVKDDQKAIVEDEPAPIVPVPGKEGWDDLDPVEADPDDWPWWRGPTFNNVANADQDPPVTWSETENIKWSVELPGRGHGTPCVVGDRMFVPSGDRKKQLIWMLCLDRETGKQIWQKTVTQGNTAEKLHDDNSSASSTPACDGDRIFFPYQTDDAVMMIAMDMDGEVVWNEKISWYYTVQGFSLSPVIYKSAVIVSTDSKGPSCLAALHRKTGEVIWRVARPGDHETYASPLVANIAGRDQLIIIGPDKTRSYDPNTGASLWECEGPAQFNTAVVAFSKDTVYSTGGWPERALMAIRGDGTGDVTGTHLVWKSDKKAGYVPSPLYHDGFIYAAADKGLMRCYDAAEGTVVWEKKLGTLFYSSPVLVGDKIYVFDRKKGSCFVMKTGREYELLAENKLPYGAFATPVITRSRIYIRTLGDLYCIGE
ncbi:MAG: PQQ-binding-like beta-propeller repeat protein [Kiritimatiellia bacterium]|nr:PQQ-binding-like beta-propeller repeat protein [Kiritimatiellia bacterium]MDP6847495.1 PQQ-binding-like beta-propeller repeat protein [Kiritimatiellia bacterium]